MLRIHILTAPRRSLLTGNRAMPFLVCLVLAALTVPSLHAAQTHAADARSTSQVRIPPAGIDGALVICGGGTLPDAILQRFIELAGGEKAHLVIIPTASESADKTPVEKQLEPWKTRKPASVVVMHTRSRQAADDAKFTEPLQKATGVWFGGGSQSRIAEAYLGTAVEQELYALLKRGGVIGGTSAGAAIMSRLMIASGNPEAKTAMGFNLLPGAIVDQHFVKRNRKPRLEALLEKNPGLFGAGIDEGTALVVKGRDMRVLGDSTVTVCLSASSSRPSKTIELKSGAVADLTALRNAAAIRSERAPISTRTSVPELANGSLVIVGGGGMPEDVTKKFIELAGGPDALIVVLPTANPDPIPPNSGAGFFRKAGAKNVEVLTARKLEDVEAPKSLDLLKKAKGIWFGGGRQWRFVDAYAGTKAEELMHDVLRRGGVIGGSSAGATIQGDYLCRGSPLNNTEIMSEGYERGLGFLPGVAIDQHFTQRKRFADMTALMKSLPQYLGIGLDESTAILVMGHVAKAIGKNQVHFFDRQRPIVAGKPDYQSIAAGGSYDLKGRKVLSVGVSPAIAAAPQFSPSLYQSMRWRMIGPFRGGRTVGATGVPGQPNVFYIGVNNGGVWKTTDFGRTWNPIFDDQPTGSIGALAVAPSDTNTLYVGSGEGLQRPDLSTGDGIYKSINGGKTWQHLGLRDGQQIGAIIVDPRNANRVFAAVLGHPYGANEERGVFRSIDGGQTWQKVLYKDENTGAIALAFDPSNPQTIYADLWSSRQGPWENGAWQGPGSGLYKSTDGGTTWRQLTKGLPTTQEGLGRIGFGIAPSDPQRIYAVVDAPQQGGVYRSDDAGESWRRINSERRVWGRGSDFAEVKVDPKNKDTIYVANTSTYRSTDGGQTFTAFKGAPGGDDYHTVWINPDNPQILLLASDQGATISVNGGQTWSSWYNQPTAQFYHVITDNQFPYWVYGGQQESGSVGIASRGNDGQITSRDWQPVGVEEYGYVAPDPLNPNLIYGGKVTRFDRVTGQVHHVAPEALRTGKYRFLRTAPLLFSPVDPHTLYLGANVLFKTRNGGHSWEIISPDLSRETPEVPESIGIFRTPELAKQARRGVIYTVAPTYQDINAIWAGTDDGLIHVTSDGGKCWKNVTPPDVTSWSKVSIIEAGRFDRATAYAAINRIRLDDQHPHIYRTHDGGQTWQKITNGLPDNAPVNTVREDPVSRGLLFAGTERAVFVSFDDGDHWQPLRLNMPATSIRDLVIHQDDVVVGTHGRSFWILDDITPLRQITADVAASDAYLFRPQVAYRVPRNVGTDTPLPPEEPAGRNPPDGAIIDYYFKTASSGPVTLEILDHANKLVRRYKSTDKPEPVDDRQLEIPTYWIRPPRILQAQAGMQRFVWDLHYPPPEEGRRPYPISAIYRDTPSMPQGPVVLPGEYTVKLTVNGKSLTQTLTVKMDPRVKTPAEALAQQFAIAMGCYEGMRQIREARAQMRSLRAQLKTARDRAAESLAEAIAALEGKMAALEGASGGPGPRGGGSMRGLRRTGERTLTRLSGELGSLMALVEASDSTPTTQAVAAADELQRSLAELLGRWGELNEKDLNALNAQLRQAKLPVIGLEK